MKRITKILLIVILGLSLFQFGSYFLYGKRNIEIYYYEHFTPLIQDVDSLYIYSKIELKNHERQEIQKILKSNYNLAVISNDTTMFYKKQYKKATTKVRIIVNHKFPFHVLVYENLRAADDYAEVWKSEFDWFLGKWVLRQKINIGQS